MIFSDRNCNYPQPAYAKWWISQFRRWGMVSGPQDYQTIASQVMATSIYEEAMKEIGYQHPGRDDQPWKMMDGFTFDPSGDIEAYVQGFPIKSLKG